MSEDVVITGRGNALESRVIEAREIVGLHDGAHLPDGEARRFAGPGDLAVALGVLRAEIEGLQSLAAALDGSFEAAVARCAGIRGRIIVSGMGKSGHVAHKIAATLASTGKIAQFVHPAEASHGDLGMIGREDLILALSNSGETAELADLLAYARRFAIPVVAITSGAGSSLAQAADIVLLLPTAREACPMGLAPTTTTTMMMALGDALAIALLERKGFSSADFRSFHPGGRLGARLRRVEELMHGGAAVPLVPASLPVADAILVMTSKAFGCVGVRDDSGVLIGVVTDGDLRRHMADGILARPVGEIMHGEPRTIGANALADEALGVMNRNAITSLFVVDAAKHPVGILHVHDCLRAGIA